MDMHCVRCNEPWDIYGLTHGDVKAWEADAIKAGEGCPCCRGKESKDYGLKVSYIEVGRCADCDRPFSIHEDDLYYDGSRKYLYHNSGNIMLDSQDDIERYLKIELDCNLNLKDNLICKSCAENYTVCDECNSRIKSEDSFYVQEENKEYCEDCYSEAYNTCQECEATVKSESLKEFNSKDYCEHCFDKLVTVCDICNEYFLKEDIIEGVNGERCCSEECADDSAG